MSISQNLIVRFYLSISFDKIENSIKKMVIGGWEVREARG